MAKQDAIADKNNIKALLIHSGTADTAETIRWSGQTSGAANIHVTGGTVTTGAASDYAVIIDSSASGTTYYGFADAGSSGTAAVWKIKREVDTGGTQTQFTFADGNTNFDNVWNNRGTYNYS